MTKKELMDEIENNIIYTEKMIEQAKDSIKYTANNGMDSYNFIDVMKSLLKDLEFYENRYSVLMEQNGLIDSLD